MTHPISEKPLKILSASEIPLHELDGWSISSDQKSLNKQFKFKNFQQAFAFMTACYEPIEAMNHHPDWSNVYGTVNVTLNTHDVGGITYKDIALAKVMNEVMNELLNKS